MLLDQMHILDVLKTAKVSLADDIAMARHAQQQRMSTPGQQQDQGEEDEPDFDGMLEFLEDPWWCVKMLHSSTKQVNYQHRVVGRLVQYICESLTDKVTDMLKDGGHSVQECLLWLLNCMLASFFPEHCSGQRLMIGQPALSRAFGNKCLHSFGHSVVST